MPGIITSVVGDVENRTYKLKVPCFICGQTCTVILSIEEYENLTMRGQSVTVALSNQTRAIQNLIAFNSCGDCNGKRSNEEVVL